MNRRHHVLTDDHPAIARRAWLPILVCLIAAAVVWHEGDLGPAWPWTLAAFLLAWKFRDTDRHAPAAALGVLAPVDGWVISITASDGVAPRRIGIFVDPFAVATVRAPIEGGVLDPFAPGGPGRGLWLRTDEGDEVTLALRAPLGLGRPQATVDIGERVGQGGRCGWLGLGYWAEVTVPADAALRVRRGGRVRAGETVLAELHRAQAPSH